LDYAQIKKQDKIYNAIGNNACTNNKKARLFAFNLGEELIGNA